MRIKLKKVLVFFSKNPISLVIMSDNNSNNNKNPSTANQPIILDFDFDVSDFGIDSVEEIKSAFVREALEILSDLEKTILQIEADPTNDLLLGKLFRKIHTLKGSSGGVPGGQLIATLSHEFEALLEQLRKNKIPPDVKLIDLFLVSARLLSVLINSLRDRRELLPEELSEIIEGIAKFANAHIPTPANDTEASTTEIEATESAAPIATEQATVTEPLQTMESINSSTDKATKTQGVKKNNIKAVGSGTKNTAAKNAKKNKSNSEKEEGVWLSNSQLKEMMKISGEMIVLKNSYQMMIQSTDLKTNPDVFQRRQTEFSQSFSKAADKLQEQVKWAQREEASTSFEALAVVIRQATSELKKDVEIIEEGFDLRIEKGLAKGLFEALVHLLRNSIDHGIESPQERLAHGKEPKGKIKINLSEKNEFTILEIQDDGQGLDKERILNRAIKNGLVTEDKAKNLSEKDIFNFIFHNGFSTKEKVSTISGRGVGLDVVKTFVDNYEGRIEINSVPKKGSTFRLVIPEPRNVMVEKVLLAQWNQLQFSVPLSAIGQISSCDTLQFTMVDGLRFCQHDKRTVPILTYKEMRLLNEQTDLEKVKKMSVVFVQNKEGIVGLLVDQIIRQQDIVLNRFDRLVKNLVGFKGTTVLSDEVVSFVIDPDQIVKMVKFQESAA